jgi:aquaporin Z
MVTAKKAAPAKKSAAKTAKKPVATKTVAKKAPAKPVKEVNVVKKVKKTNTVKAFTAKLFAKKYEGKETVLNFYKNPSFIGALLAETIGVFLLTTVVIATQGSPLYVLFGLVGVVVAVAAFSGAHVNPLITIGAMATRRISVVRGVFYVIAQTLGALLAFIVLSAFLAGAPEVSADAAAYGQTAMEIYTLPAIPTGVEWYIVATELLGAAIIALFFARALRYRKSVYTYAVTIGSGLFIAILVSLTITGYLGDGGNALNPAVAVALRVFEGDNIGWSLLAYALAPAIGGVVGFLVNDLLVMTGAEEN